MTSVQETILPIMPSSGSMLNVDALIEPPLRDALGALDGRAPLLAGMVRYHLGYAEPDLAPAEPREVDRGKRIRPAVALLAAGASGGEPERAAPLGAAIELLHNFTLIHDDIQDNSPSRRHRPTVWARWGEAQAINAGDALFASAHLALLHATDRGVSPGIVIDLIRGFDATTIEIVSGQVLDLQFEQRQDVTSSEYIEMITGKTARIVEFAAGGHLRHHLPLRSLDLRQHGVEGLARAGDLEQAVEAGVVDRLLRLRGDGGGDQGEEGGEQDSVRHCGVLVRV